MEIAPNIHPSYSLLSTAPNRGLEVRRCGPHTGSPAVTDYQEDVTAKQTMNGTYDVRNFPCLLHTIVADELELIVESIDKQQSRQNT